MPGRCEAAGRIGKQVQDLYELVTVSREAVFLEIRFQKTAPIQTSVESPHIHWETGKVFCIEDL